MTSKDFYDFFLPSAIPDRKSAARAVAAGSFAGILLFSVFAVCSLLLFVRKGSTPMAEQTAIAAFAMIIVTVGTWKRIVVAPILGLLVASESIAWAISRREISAVLLIVPLMGGFWTATRGIATLRKLARQNSIQADQE